MKITITIIAVCIASLCAAQTAPKPKFYAWLEDVAKISVRKSFDGSSKDEGKPASFLWFDDLQNKERFLLVDLGVKIREFEIPLRNQLLTIVPKVEWHTDQRAKTSKNSLSAGINIEYYPLQAGTITPWFLGSLDVERDGVKDFAIFKPKIFMSLFGLKNFSPGHPIQNKNNVFTFRYYPYTGIERFQKLDSASVGSTYWTTRLFAEFWPWTAKRIIKHDTVRSSTGADSAVTRIERDERRYLQLTAEGTYRHAISDKLYKQGNVTWLTLGLNIYPDGYDKIGLGLDYNVGYDPSASFDKANKLSIGVRIKL